MSESFFRGNEAELLTGSANFSAIISGNSAAYGFSIEECAAYQAAQELFAERYQIARDPSTRTKGNVSAKNVSKDALRTISSDYARRVNGLSTVTDQMKLDAGLNVPKHPTPVPVYEYPPMLDIESMDGHVATVRVHAGPSLGRRKPFGVKGVSAFSCVGETPLANPEDWTFVGSSQKNVFTVTFDASLPPGTKVWLTAYYYNTKSEAGPGCEPVGLTINYPSSMQAPNRLKIAA